MFFIVYLRQTCSGDIEQAVWTTFIGTEFAEPAGQPVGTTVEVLLGQLSKCGRDRCHEETMDPWGPILGTFGFGKETRARFCRHACSPRIVRKTFACQPQWSTIRTKICTAQHNQNWTKGGRSAARVSVTGDVFKLSSDHS